MQIHSPCLLSLSASWIPNRSLTSTFRGETGQTLTFKRPSIRQFRIVISFVTAIFPVLLKRSRPHVFDSLDVSQLFIFDQFIKIYRIDAREPRWCWFGSAETLTPLRTITRDRTRDKYQLTSPPPHPLITITSSTILHTIFFSSPRCLTWRSHRY